MNWKSRIFTAVVWISKRLGYGKFGHWFFCVIVERVYRWANRP